MPVYATIGGTQRELSAIPAMVNGAQRELQSFLATVGGVQRELLASKNKWERYSLKVVTSYEAESAGNTNITQSKDASDRYVWWYSDCTFDQTTGKFTLSGNNFDTRAYSGAVDNQETIYELLASGCVWTDGAKNSSSQPSASISGLSTVRKLYDSASSHFASSSSIRWTTVVYNAVAVESYERGAYIDTVEDSSADAYPDNGAQGGYWYVKITENVKPKQLNYIQTSGKQYIDTLFKPNQDTKLEIEFEFLESNTGTDHHIASVNNSSQFYAFRAKSNLSGFASRYYTEALKDVPSSALYGRHTFVRDRNVVSLDGGTEIVSNYGTFQIRNTLPIGCFKNASGAVSGFSALRIFPCKVFDAGVLVRDYVPWQTAAGDIGLMDVLTDTFYGNAGTGVFTGG